MAVSDEQIAFVTDLFSGLGPVTTRKMFGGLGIYADGTIFAVVLSDGSLKLKAAGDMARTYADAGWEPWSYPRKDGTASFMPYWTVPDDLLDDPDAVCRWARHALAAL